MKSRGVWTYDRHVSVAEDGHVLVFLRTKHRYISFHVRHTRILSTRLMKLKWIWRRSAFSWELTFKALRMARVNERSHSFTCHHEWNESFCLYSAAFNKLSRNVVVVAVKKAQRCWASPTRFLAPPHPHLRVYHNQLTVKFFFKCTFPTSLAAEVSLRSASGSPI